MRAKWAKRASQRFSRIWRRASSVEPWDRETNSHGFRRSRRWAWRAVAEARPGLRRLLHCCQRNPRSSQASLGQVLRLRQAHRLDALVKNIGLDGSGDNCGDIDVFKHLEISDKINFNFDVKYNKEKNRIYTDLNYKHFKKRIFVVRVINKLSRITIGKNIIK